MFYRFRFDANAHGEHLTSGLLTTQITGIKHDRWYSCLSRQNRLQRRIHFAAFNDHQFVGESNKNKKIEYELISIFND